MIQKENKKFRKKFIVTEYAALTEILLGKSDLQFVQKKDYLYCVRHLDTRYFEVELNDSITSALSFLEIYNMKSLITKNKQNNKRNTISSAL